MSLVYAENSNEIRCALHMFYTCNQSVRYLMLDVLEHQDPRGYTCMRVYVHT